MRSKSRNTFTTGEISKICNVAQRTVIKWFDQGIIKGYVIPGTKDRRIPLNYLIEFMKKNNIPFDLFFQAEKCDLIEYCWEYNYRIFPENSGCKDCIIFETKSLKCYAFTKKFNILKKLPDIECQKCDYYLKYWKREKTDNQGISENDTPYCWEYFLKIKDENRKCESCIIYKTKCLKCFLFFENIPNTKNICGIKCEDCGFYNILEKYMTLDESLKSVK